MTAIGTWTIQRAFPPANGFVCVLITVLLVSLRAESAVLPLPVEQDSWSVMVFPSVTFGTFDAGILSIATAASGDLEIGSQFGPSNPGRHYGTGGTLGGTFSATLIVSRVQIAPNGSVTNGGIVSVEYNGGSPGSVGTDYGIIGGYLLRGTALEVLLDATGDNTLDILYAITDGALQTDNPDPNVGVYAPSNLGLLRISAANLPSNWTSPFNFTGASLHSFGIPEPGTCLLTCLAALFMSLARSPRQL